MDPVTADLIKVCIGVAGAFLGKQGFEWIRELRKGRSMKEASLTSSLASAVERGEKKIDELEADHREEIKRLRAELEAERRRTVRWRNYGGSLEYLLAREQIDIPFPPPTSEE